MPRCLRLLCLLPLFSAPAGAAEAPGWRSLVPDDVPTTRHDIPVGAMIVGRVARIAMQKTRLTDLYAQRIIPEIRHVGDAGNSMSWGCLTVATRDGPVVIRPGSGEMGAHDMIIAISVERAPRDWPPYGTEACPIRTGLNETVVVTFDDGVRFGMSRAAVLDALGRPSLARGDLLDYRASAPVPGCPRCEGEEEDLAFRFEGGTMAALEIRQVSMGE